MSASLFVYFRRLYTFKIRGRKTLQQRKHIRCNCCPHQVAIAESNKPPSYLLLFLYTIFPTARITHSPHCPNWKTWVCAFCLVFSHPYVISQSVLPDFLISITLFHPLLSIPSSQIQSLFLGTKILQLPPVLSTSNPSFPQPPEWSI